MPARKTTATAAAAASHASLNEALFAVQQQMPEFQKTEINPHFNSSYAGLQTILPKVLEILGANGVMVTQFPTYLIAANGIDVVPALETCFTHVATGQEKAHTTPLQLGGKQTAQAHAAAITYMRRYGIVSALGIVLEKDDDGNAASVPVSIPAPAAAPVVVPAATALPWQA